MSHLNMLTDELEINQIIRNLQNEAGPEELSYNVADLAGFVGCSSAMKSALRRAMKLSKVDSTVLISGETGVGKNIVAHIIHNLSGRRDFKTNKKQLSLGR